MPPLKTRTNESDMRNASLGGTERNRSTTIPKTETLGRICTKWWAELPNFATHCHSITWWRQIEALLPNAKSTFSLFR